MQKALFLDRDGVINIDFGYVHKIDNFVFIDEIFPLCLAFLKKDYKIIVVTNQSGVGRGYYTKDDFYTLSDFMCEKMKEKGIEITDIYASFTLEDIDRKPSPNMLLKAAKKHNIDLKNSVMIGDKLSDMQAGFNAGVSSLFLVNNESQKELNFFKKVKKYDEIIKDIL